MRRIIASAVVIGALTTTSVTAASASTEVPTTGRSTVMTALMIACVADPFTPVCTAFSKAIADGKILGGVTEPATPELPALPDLGSLPTPPEDPIED